MNKTNKITKPAKRKPKLKFTTQTAHMKYACKELELFRILNFELKYELNPTY